MENFSLDLKDGTINIVSKLITKSLFVFFFIFKCIYFILPGIIANMTPIFVKHHLHFLAYPIDGNRRWIDGSPLLGSHKTWRGVICGTAAAMIIVALQKFLYRLEGFKDISLFPYEEYSVFLIGFLMGFGALFGDIVKSFFKRRVHISPGAKFIPWDQLDAILGGLLFLSFAWIPSWRIVLTTIVLAFILHIAVRYVGYYLKINKERW